MDERSSRWLRTPGYFASDESNGRLLLAYANQQVRVGRYPNIKGLLEEPFLDDVQLGQLADQQIRFVVVDRRIASWDPMFGYYFDLTRGGPIPSSQLFQAERYTKWETLPGVDRILDTGSIYVYDVNSLSHATAQP